MPDFPYLATVIVPIYNAERFLDSCIDSLIRQTMDFAKIEVLLINDGSVDSSEEICKKYAKKYKNIRFISKQNEGLSKTRNRGLAEAKGKYIFYLDSDDSFRNDTIESVTSFFETVYDTVDLVTYRITPYYNGRPKLVHYRYKTLIKTGVYDLTDPKNAFITQTNINICVKNKREKNILFDTTKDFKHEDEKYCCDVLKAKMKIGFCADGEYIYNRNNEQSIVSSSFSPDIIFDSSMDFYEGLFAEFSYKVPQYFQGIVFNDLRWKFKEYILMPTKGSDAYLRQAQRRIDNLLQRIDADIIVNHPTITKEHLYYWLYRKPNCHPTAFTFRDKICIVADGRVLDTFDSFQAKTEDNVIVVKSPIFAFLNSSQVKTVVTDGEKKNELCMQSCNSENIPAYAKFSLPDGLNGNKTAYLSVNGQHYKIKLFKS